MLLAIKSTMPLDKLRMCNFYRDDMQLYTYLPQINWYYFVINKGMLTDRLIEDLTSEKGIIEYSVDIDGLEPKFTEVIPINDNFAQQWGFKNTGQLDGFPGEDARITYAWSIETGSPEIIVAVVDSGIDVDHECLMGRIYSDPTEVVNVGVDTDGNTYKNDFMGWNFDKNTFQSYTSSHGTALASIITTNGNGMSGVSQAKIMPVAIGNIVDYDIKKINFTSDCRAGEKQDPYTSYYYSIPSAHVSAGIIYAADKGAHIINVAYAKHSTALVWCCATYPVPNHIPDVRDAIKYAGKAGCVVVTAAGDCLPESQFPTPREGAFIYGESCDGENTVNATGERNCFPGAYSRYFPFQINVTAHTNWGYLYYDRVITFMAYNGSYVGWERGCAYSKANVDIAAPGKDILVALPNDQYGLAGGTSVASAFVAGAAALVWSRNQYLRNYQVVDILLSSARKNTYWSTRVACGGMLDVKAAVLGAFI